MAPKRYIMHYFKEVAAGETFYFFDNPISPLAKTTAPGLAFEWLTGDLIAVAPDTTVLIPMWRA